MSSKVKLLLYWKSILLSLILYQALSNSISVHISPGSIVRKLKLGIFMRKFGGFIKKLGFIK